MDRLGVVLASSDAAFFVVFFVFVAAFAVLSVITLRWAIRRDRPGRAAWRDRSTRTGQR